MDRSTEKGVPRLSSIPCRSGYALLLLALLGLAACHRKTPEEMLMEAYDLYQSQDIIGAEMKYEKIIERTPEGPVANGARMGLARCYIKDKDFEKGREQLDIVLKSVGTKTPDCLPVIGHKLSSYFIENKPDKAVEVALATSATLHGAPELVRQQFQIMLSEAYMFDKKEDKAAEICQQVIREWPNNPDLHIIALDRLSVMPQSRKDYKKAMAVYQEYLNTHPQSPLKADLTYGIGEYLRMMGQMDKANASYDVAEAEYRKQIETAVGADAKGNLLMKLAHAQQGRGNLKAAKQTVQQVIKEFPGKDIQQMAKINLADLAMAENKPNEAIALLKEVQMARPDTNLANLASKRIQEIQASTLRPTSGTQALTPARPAPPAGAAATSGTVSGKAAAPASTPAMTTGSAAGKAPTPPAAKPAARTTSPTQGQPKP